MTPPACCPAICPCTVRVCEKELALSDTDTFDANESRIVLTNSRRVGPSVTPCGDLPEASPDQDDGVLTAVQFRCTSAALPSRTCSTTSGSA